MLRGRSRIRGIGADINMHSRDEGFKNQAHHKTKPDPLYDKVHPKKPVKCYRLADFTYDAVAGTFICPAGILLSSQFTTRPLPPLMRCATNGGNAQGCGRRR